MRSRAPSSAATTAETGCGGRAGAVGDGCSLLGRLTVGAVRVTAEAPMPRARHIPLCPAPCNALVIAVRDRGP